jgi:hypothetical protein
MTNLFKKLKHCFTTILILIHFDLHHECIVETDTLDFALGGTLSQTAKDKKLHPNIFHSRKLSPAEINYEIHNKELLAIVDCFKVWRRYLEGSLYIVQVFTDHKNLEYFMTTKVLNRRQACWAQELDSMDFKMFYRKGTSNSKPDALSRCSEYCPEKGGGGDQPIQTVLNEKHFGTISVISIGVMARIPIPPYAPYFLVFVPILLIDLRDRALMRYDIVEGFCSYLCSCACEVV